MDLIATSSLLNTILTLLAALPILYFSFKIHHKGLRILSSLFSLFLILSVLLNLAEFLADSLGMVYVEVLADNVLSPATYFVLFILAAYYARRVG